MEDGFPRSANEKFATICVVVMVGLAYSRAVATRVSPGALRVVFFTPCLVLNALLPCIWLDPLVDVMVTAVALSNFSWWTNFKLLAFALDRGQLCGDGDGDGDGDGGGGGGGDVVKGNRNKIVGPKRKKLSLLKFLATGALPVIFATSSPSPSPSSTHPSASRQRERHGGGGGGGGEEKRSSSSSVAAFLQPHTSAINLVCKTSLLVLILYIVAGQVHFIIIHHTNTITLYATRASTRHCCTRAVHHRCDKKNKNKTHARSPR